MIAVNLCVFNNPLVAISDQIFFAQAVFRDRGYSVDVSDRLDRDALNLVIENINVAADGFNHVEAVRLFCQRFGKQVGIVMTEHIERQSAEIVFNGAPLHDMTYISNKISRFFGAVALSEHAFGFFTLGSLPELNSFRDIFPLHRLYRLPFPPIDTPPLATSAPGAGGRKGLRPARSYYDGVFTGNITPYRAEVLGRLRRRFRILDSSLTLTEAERHALYLRAKVAINIPQDPHWGWISSMRVMFGLRAGRPTVHFGGTLRAGDFDRAVPLEEDLAGAVRDPDALYARQVVGYEQLVRETAAQFPDRALRLWAFLEGLDGDATEAPALPSAQPVV